MDHAGVIYSKSQLQVDKKLSKVAAFLAKVKNGEDKTALVNQLVQKNKKGLFVVALNNSSFYKNIIRLRHRLGRC
jgi:hypothetical protein